MSKMVRKAHLLTQEQIDFLENIDSLPASEHLRRAIDDYRRKLDNRFNVSKSPSIAEFPVEESD